MSTSVSKGGAFMELETLVHGKVLAVVRLRRSDAQAVTSDQELRSDLGLDSLDLAELGATIEAALDAPVFDDVPIGAILTVGDLVEVCRQAGTTAEGTGE